MKYIDTWDLETIFPGGTKSEKLQKKIIDIKQQIKDYEFELSSWSYDGSQGSTDTLKKLLKMQEVIGKGIGQAGTFVRMSLDAYMDDEHGHVVYGQVVELMSDMRKLGNIYTKKLVEIDDQAWEGLLADKDLEKLNFALNEIRTQGKRLLSDAEETLIAELDKDGLSAWSDLYDTTVSIMTVPFTDEQG